MSIVLLNRPMSEVTASQLSTFAKFITLNYATSNTSDSTFKRGTPPSRTKKVSLNRASNTLSFHQSLPSAITTGSWSTVSFVTTNPIANDNLPLNNLIIAQSGLLTVRVTIFYHGISASNMNFKFTQNSITTIRVITPTTITSETKTVEEIVTLSVTQGEAILFQINNETDITSISWRSIGSVEIV